MKFEYEKLRGILLGNDNSELSVGYACMYEHTYVAIMLNIKKNC